MGVVSEQELRERAALVGQLGLALNSKDVSLDAVLKMLKNLIAKKKWTHFLTKVGEEVVYEQTPEDFIRFITTERPNGLGTSVETVEHSVKNDKEARMMYRKAITPPKHKHHDSYNVTISRGNSQSYGLEVLYERHTDLYEKVLLGETTVNKAMIKAGERKPYISVPLHSMERLADALRRRLDDDDLAMLIRLLLIDD